MLMQRRVLLLLGVIVCVPAFAQAAITISTGSHILAKATAGQTVNIMLTSTGGDMYTDGNMRLVIGAGGPQVTHVFGDTTTAIPVANLAGSIWAGSAFTGIAASPDGTLTDSTGRRTSASFLTAGGPQSTSGIYATLTFTTVGIAPGMYTISLTTHPNGTSDLFNGLDGNDEPISAGETYVAGILTVVPEPGSVVLGLFAVAGLATVAIRRHRGRKAA